MIVTEEETKEAVIEIEAEMIVVEAETKSAAVEIDPATTDDIAAAVDRLVW